MAITLNVGGSKKVSQNYDSQGVSLNVTAEVSEPGKVAEAANDLFDLVNQLLEEQIAKLNGDKAGNESTYRPASNGNGNGHANGHGRFQHVVRSNGNGHTKTNHRDTPLRGGVSRLGSSGGGTSGGGRKLTQAQHRAITNMTKRLDEEPDAWVQHEFGVDKVEDLTVKQASEFIDQLKSSIEAKSQP